MAEELTAGLAPYWAQLTEQSGGVLAAHTILALWRATGLDIYEELAEDDRNVVKWACLLCDIAKLGAPRVQGRDPAHAFRSGSAALELFARFGFLESGQVGRYPLAQRLLAESFQPLPALWRAEALASKQPMVSQMPSHHNLPALFDALWSGVTPLESFCDQVLRLVLFSHSLEGLGSAPNAFNLSPAHRKRFCSPHFYSLMQILLVADNEAYILFDPTYLARCKKEIMQNYADIIKPPRGSRGFGKFGDKGQNGDVTFGDKEEAKDKFGSPVQSLLDAIPELSPNLTKDGDGPVEESKNETMEDICNSISVNESP